MHFNYRLLIVSLVIAYSPLKELAFLSPIFFIVLISLRYRQYQKIFLMLFLYTMGGLFYYLVYPGFIWTNYFVFLITISPFLLLAININPESRTINLHTFYSILKYTLIIQAVVGLVQFGYSIFYLGHSIDGATGDAVAGTISFSLLPDKSGSNVLYSLLQSSLLIIMFTIRGLLNITKDRKWLIIILFSWFTASTLHTLFYWMAAFILIYLVSRMLPMLNRIERKTKYGNSRYSIIGVILMGTILLYMFPKNIKGVNYYYDKIFDTTEISSSPKSYAVYRTINELPHENPTQPIFGLGPGQYTSRAAFLMSGKYLNQPLPLKPTVAINLEKYIMPIWEPLLYRTRYVSGSTEYPFFSWLTVYGETGLIGLIVIMVLAAKRFITYFKSYRRSNPIGYINCFFIVYIALLGLHENYWEWSQYMFSVLLTLKILNTHRMQISSQ
jgi:hypothetical protein